MTLTAPSPMIATKKAVLATAIMIGVVGISVAAAPLAAEAQIAIKENGVGIVDQSNVEQTAVQVLNQEACTNESGEQSNDCEVDQTQTADIRSRHDTVKNSINNIR
jgi:hypothetical protein